MLFSGTALKTGVVKGGIRMICATSALGHKSNFLLKDRDQFYVQIHLTARNLHWLWLLMFWSEFACFEAGLKLFCTRYTPPMYNKHNLRSPVGISSRGQTERKPHGSKD